MLALAQAPTTPSPAVLMALASLPKCYSAAFDACITCTDDPNTADPKCQALMQRTPGCRDVLIGYLADKPTVEAAVDALPFCPAPSFRGMLVVGAIAAAAGAALGYFFAKR